MLLYILSILLLLLIALEIYLVIRKRKKFAARDYALIASEWKSIQEKISREPKHALMEADKLLDFALKKKGYAGTLGEKLQKAEKSFSHLDNVWKAHKLRNRAVHEVGFILSEESARKALSDIKIALWDLGIKL